jgi:hypothetical protein
MMKHFIYIVFLVVLGATVITSCVKEKNFPIEPVIQFKEFILYNNDSADCIIKFKDGDGDIGIMPGDTAAADDLKMKYLYKSSDGLFHPVDATFGTLKFDTLYYSFRIPNITPNGQYKALDGEIKIKLRTAPLFNPAHKVVKFEIRLADRAGHVSNMVSTNPINVNQ